MNWPPPVALEFAHRAAEVTGLTASNLDAGLESIVQSSGCNPGSIVHMVKMAQQSQDRMDDQIKFHVLRFSRGKKSLMNAVLSRRNSPCFYFNFC